MFKKINLKLCIIILVLITALFFHYPLMMWYQHSDSSLADYNRFAITTERGDTGYTIDVNIFSLGILSLYNKPGLFLKDGITYEYEYEIMPQQGSLPYVMHAIIYLFLKDVTLTLIFGSVISVVIIIIILYYLSKFIQEKYGFNYSDIKTVFLITCMFTVPNIIVDVVNFRYDGFVFLRPYVGYIGRFIHINHIVIFLLLWFSVLLYILFKNKNDKKSFILLGISLAILQYTYPYFYVSALIFTGFALLIKYKVNIETVKKLACTYLTWFVLSIPYLVNYVVYSEFNHEYMIRQGILDLPLYLNSTSFAYVKFSLILLLFVLFLYLMIDYFYIKKINNNKNNILQTIQESNLMISLYLTSFIVLNLEYIVGYNIQPYHWVLTFIYPIMILITFIYFLKVMKIIKYYTNISFPTYDQIKFYVNILIIIFIIFSLSGLIIHLYISANQWYKYYYFDNEDIELFNFIKTSTDRNAVLFADTTYTTDIISVNTNRKTLLGNTLITRIPTKEEIHSRLIFGYKKLNFSKSRLLDDINESLECKYPIAFSKNQNLSSDHYSQCNNFNLYYQTYVYTELINELSDAYNYSNQTFRLDYVIYSTNISKMKDETNIVFKNERYIVKKV